MKTLLLGDKAHTAYSKGYDAAKRGDTKNPYQFRSRSAGFAGWWDKGYQDALKEMKSGI